MATVLGETVSLDAGVARTEGPGGTLILSETMPGARSVAVGLWVKWGAAHEPPALQGVAHLLEHMVFKATERRTAHAIAAAIEGLGGHLDAYTSREHTLYQARVPAEHLPIAVDVLADLVFHPRHDAADLELERKVVLEEIAGVEDTPDDWIFDLHARALWGEHPYGSPILGSRETVTALERDVLAQTWAAAYRPSRCALIAAGRLEHEALVDEAVRRWPAENDRVPEAEVALPRARPPTAQQVERETAQMHLCLGVPTFADDDPRKPALEVALAALGGGMSSRLFQRVREELGLAYAIYAFHSFYRRGGVAGVYAGTQPATAAQTVETIEQELRRLGTYGLPGAELQATKNQVKGMRLLALESTTARMYRLAHPVLYDEPYETIDAELARIDAVGADEVGALCADALAPERWTRVSLGPARPDGPQRMAAR